VSNHRICPPAGGVISYILQIVSFVFRYAIREDQK
jgi:hypothetical protein